MVLNREVIMTRDDILTLAKAGFTAEQIIALGSIESKTSEPVAPAPAPVEPTAPAPQPVAPAPAPAPVEPTAPAPQDPFQKLFEQMTGIKQAIQTSNLQNSVIATAPQTTDDILASIIQPTKNKEV